MKEGSKKRRRRKSRIHFLKLIIRILKREEKKSRAKMFAFIFREAFTCKIRNEKQYNVVIRMKFNLHVPLVDAFFVCLLLPNNSVRYPRVLRASFFFFLRSPFHLPPFPRIFPTFLIRNLTCNL